MRLVNAPRPCKKIKTPSVLMRLDNLTMKIVSLNLGMTSKGSE